MLIFSALATLLYPLNQGLSQGWASPPILGSIVVSAVLWCLFLLQEQRCPYRLVDLALFRNRNFNLGNAAALLLMLSYAGAEFLLPFFFEDVHGYAPAVAGLLLAVPAVALMVAGPIAGSMADRYGSWAITTCAALLAAGSFVLMGMFTVTTSPVFIIATLALLGIATGLFFPPNMVQILGEGAVEGEGVASSVMMTLRNLGSVVGVALFGTIVVMVIVAAYPGVTEATAGELPIGIFVAGFRAAFISGAVLSLAAAILSGLIGRQARPAAQEAGSP